MFCASLYCKINTIIYLFIYLQYSPYTAGAFHRDYTPLTGPLCRGEGDSPQHRH